MIREKIEFKEFIEVFEETKDNLKDFNIVLDESELDANNYDIVLQLIAKNDERTMITVFSNMESLEDVNVKAVLIDGWLDEDAELKAFYNNKVEENYRK